MLGGASIKTRGSGNPDSGKEGAMLNFGPVANRKKKHRGKKGR